MVNRLLIFLAFLKVVSHQPLHPLLHLHLFPPMFQVCSVQLKFHLQQQWSREIHLHGIYKRFKNSCLVSTRFNLCWSVSCFGTHLVDSFQYLRVSVMVSCSRDLEIYRNITESSSTVNLQLSWSAFSIYYTILPVLRSSDHHAQTYDCF